MIQSLKKLISTGILAIKFLLDTLLAKIVENGRLLLRDLSWSIRKEKEALLALFFIGKGDIGEGVIFRVRPPNCNNAF